MVPLRPAAQGLDGARIDGGWFTNLLALARDTPWLHGPILFYADFGIVLFAVLALLAWWRARRADPAAMAGALWVVVATPLGYLVNDLVKGVFTEPRPCRALPSVHILIPCDAPTDWAFPSNHSAIAAAAAVALLVANRRIGLVAAAGAVLIAFCRVYIGAHYPHDVIVGLAVGGMVGLTCLPARRLLTPAVVRLRAGALAPLVGPSAERVPVP